MLAESKTAQHQRKAAKMYEGMALIHESLGQQQQVVSYLHSQTVACLCNQLT